MQDEYARYTIARVRLPSSKKLNDQLHHFGQSIGLFGERDRDRSAFRIFIELLRATKKNANMSSDMLASRLNLSRGTVVYHLNRLIHVGLVVHHGNRYALRHNRLELLLEEVQRDIHRTVEELKITARELDRWLEP
jgi:predicted transcriptional regulator